MTINGKTMDKTKLMTFIATENKIQAIKFIRDQTNLGLKECKDIVDNLDHNPNHYANNTIITPSYNELDEFEDQQASPLERRGSHFIDEKPSKNKNLIILLLVAVIAILVYFIIKK